MTDTYTIVNTKTGEPLRNDSGDPITRDSESAAQDVADSYTAGNNGTEFEARPVSEVIQERYLGLDLEDYAETPEDPDWSHTPRRTQLVKALLPDEAEVLVYSTGGYQGTMGFVIALDGYYWLIKEMFGSCSYCDGLLAADDRLEYGRSILRNAYAFDDASEAKKFLTEQAIGGGYGWSKIAGEMKDLIEEVEG